MPINHWPYNGVYATYFTDVSPADVLDRMICSDDSPKCVLSDEMMKSWKDTVEFMTLVSKHWEMRLSHMTLHVAVNYFDKYLDYMAERKAVLKWMYLW